MSYERELLKRCLIADKNGTMSIGLIKAIEELLAQPEQEQEVYAKGYAEAMRQQVYEAFEAGRKSAFSKDWDKERDVMSEAWYLPESKQEPVAWKDLITDIDYLITAFEDGADACDYWGDIINLRHDLKKVTLVGVQPEPLSGMKILEGLDIEKVPSYKALTFQRGVRWAEQQHKIGVDDEDN